jgi:hypothetical protein
MGRGVRVTPARFAVVAILAAMGLAPLACGSLLGIDAGKLLDPDASTFDPVLDGQAPLDSETAKDASSDVIAYVAPDAAPCQPDLSWCTTHCGPGLDNCGQMRDCPNDCPTGQRCLGNKCQCQPDQEYCIDTGACLATTDNCGNAVTCGACDGGVTCFSGACGCMPEPATQACGAQQCGQATNNCQQTVNCGVSGTSACATGEVCLADNTCCTPDNETVCASRCQTTVTNNCNQQLACPQTCPNNGVCLNTECCTPNGTCSGACMDNCNQFSQACCPATADGGSPAPDSGSSPPPDSGPSCSGSGSSCSLGCCQGLLCGQSATCVTSCATASTACSSDADCCYGLSCQSSLISPELIDRPFLTGPIRLDGGIISLGGTCE